MLSTNNEGITDPGLGVGAMGLDALGVFSTSTHATDSPFSEYLGNGNYYDGKGIYTESPESNVTKVEEDENEEGGESLGSRTGSGLIQDLATFFENKEKIGRLGSKGKMGRVVNVGTSSSTGEAEFGNLFDELVSSNGDVDGWIESPLNISQNVPQNIPQITNRNQSIDEQNINHCIGLVGQNSNVDNYSGYYNENDGENILGMGMGMEPSSGLTLSCNELDELCMLLKKHAKCADVLKSISNQYTQ
ncbi:hypothetical protein AX774_g6488 [Zancudomyces culisetae]|nr:hypothetical protein AX774_g6488 [Zancudomyces culisetae]|eukprot:OMH80082.1 hypothetical protein AX774_g6488 [Zancudomyces culisetae]